MGHYKPLAVVVGDAHLNPLIWSRRPEVSGDAFCSFNQIVEFCVHQNVDLFLAGDALDSTKPPAEVIEFLQLMFAMLKKHGLGCYVINGNHDATDPPWAVLVGAHYFDRRTVDAGVRIYGLEYRPGEALQAELAQVPPTTEVLICHQLVDVICGGISNMKAEWVPSYVPLIVMGDYHVNTQSNVNEHGQTFVYTGSTHLRSLQEDPRKSFVVLFKGDDGKVNYYRHPLATRTLYSLNFQTESVLEAELVQLNKTLDAVSDLPELVRKPLVRVRYSPTVKDVEGRVKSIVGDRAHVFVSAFDVEDVTTSTPTLGDAFSPSAALSILIDRNYNPALFDLTLALIVGESPQATLDQWRRQYVVDT